MCTVISKFRHYAKSKNIFCVPVVCMELFCRAASRWHEYTSLIGLFQQMFLWCKCFNVHVFWQMFSVSASITSHGSHAFRSIIDFFSYQNEPIDNRKICFPSAGKSHLSTSRLQIFSGQNPHPRVNQARVHRRQFKIKQLSGATDFTLKSEQLTHMDGIEWWSVGPPAECLNVFVIWEWNHVRLFLWPMERMMSLLRLQLN